MIFLSKCGLGEICIYNEVDSGRDQKRQVDEIFVKIVGIHFDYDGIVRYHVEHIGSHFGVQRFIVAENQLVGDPAFDQEAGCYAPEQED